MAYIDVKITDLEQVSKFKDSDLFLISNPIIDSTGALQDNNPYTSNSLSGGSLSGTIKTALEHDTLSVVNKWHFRPSDVRNIPKQDIRLANGDFIAALQDVAKLSSIIHENGWYKSLTASVFQNNPSVQSAHAQSTTVPNNGIPNLDYVNRTIAGAYQSLLNQITVIIGGGGTSFIPSYVGQIIHSTTLNTEDAVRNVYGSGQTINGVTYPNTHWIQHTGYFLRGNNSGVTSGIAGKKADGGSDSIKLTKDYLPNHTHTASATFSGQSSTISGSFTSKDPFYYALGSTTASGKNNQAATPHNFTKKVTGSLSGSVTPKGTVTVTISSSGGKSDPNAINTIPQYKNVYIWERVS